MAPSGKAFGISLAIYAAVLVGLIAAFSAIRRIGPARRYYTRRRHPGNRAALKPPRLQAGFFSWLCQVVRLKEDVVVRYASVDAEMYMLILRTCMQLTLLFGAVACLIILPINATSGYVSELMTPPPASTGGFAYWEANQPPSPPPGEDPAPPVPVPDFYESNIPPAPPGVQWWAYRAGVPPLPDPGTLLGPAYANYGWRYEAQGSLPYYSFSDLDRTTMSNVPDGSPRLYAHAIAAWLVTGLVCWLLWRRNHDALKLRVLYLLHRPHGADVRAILVRDLPGVRGAGVDKQMALLKSGAGKVLSKVTKGGSGAEVADEGREGGGREPRALESGASRSETLGGGREDSYSTSLPWSASSPPPPSPRPTASPLQAGLENASSECPSGSHSWSSAGTQPLARSLQHRGHPAYPAAASSSAARAKAWQAPQLATSAVGEEPALAWREGRFDLPQPWQEARAALEAGSGVEALVRGALAAPLGEENVRDVQVVYATAAADALLKEYGERKQALEDVVDWYVDRLRKGKSVKKRRQQRVSGALLGAWGRERYGLKPVKVDSLDFLTDRMEFLRDEAERLALEARSDAPMPAALATLSSRVRAALASQALWSERQEFWTVDAAPPPEEVLWENLGLRRWERATRATSEKAAFCALALFFMIPVAAVQAILSTNSLVDVFSQIAVLDAVVTAIVPGLALKIFLVLVPHILRSLVYRTGVVSLSELDLGVCTRFFIFQAITVFFGSFVAGSFFNQLKQFIKDPGSIVTVLGTAAPQTAFFFCNFLLVQAAITSPLDVLDPVGLVLCLIKSARATTARAKRRLWTPQDWVYGTSLPNACIGLLLALVFCLVCPLIAPIALIYFAVTAFVAKYQLLYVAVQRHQTGGLYWRQAFNYFMTALLIFQLLMIGILGVKKIVAPPLICVPLPFLTVLFWVAVHGNFWRPHDRLALLSAARADREEDEAPGGVEEESQEKPWPALRKEGAAPPAYLAPAFKFDQAEHDSMLDDARRVGRVLQGQHDPELLGFEHRDLERGLEEADRGEEEERPPEAAAEETSFPASR